ncbi:MAG: TonB-dependent receptor [Denitrovibrio sp.]|nr:MAG: TonB-dependent receptor [Denitrovibrio sp.]
MKSLRIALVLMFLCNIAFAENLEEIVIFEDSLALKESKTTANVEVITSEKIENIDPATTADLLKTILGVSVKSYDAKHVSIDMGGYGAEKGSLNSVIMLNGRRINSPDMSSIDWNFIPVENIDRVEAYHGGNSVLFGDRATGGAINIVTKKPIKSGFAVKAEGGSYGTYHGNLAGQYASEKFAFLLNLDKYSTDGYRDNSELETKSLSADATYYHDYFEINLFGNYTDSEYGLPGSVTKAEIAQHGSKYSSRSDDGGDDSEYIFGLGAKVFLPVGELNIKTDFHNRDRDYKLYGSSNTDKLSSKAVNPFYVYKIEHNDYSNRLIVGGEYISYTIDGESDFDSFDIDRTMTAFYMSDNIKLKGFLLEAGYRVQKLSDDYKFEDKSKDDTENAYNILAGYDFGSLGSFFVKYDRSFRFPTTDELREYDFFTGAGKLNTDIETQKANTYSLGYSYSRDAHFLDVSVYKQDTDNEIFTNPTYTPFANENIDTKRKGADIRVGYDSDTLLMELAYSYVDADIDEGVSKGNDIPLLSKNKVKATFGYRCSAGVGVYYFANYYSSSYQGSDYGNTQDKLDAYWVSDMKIDYKYDRFSIFFKVNNMFNEKYYDYAFKTAFYEAYYPAAERNFAAGLTFRY